MNIYSKELAASAEWIWQHKDEPHYWEWQDLTRHNLAPDSLNLPEVIAWNIFTILRERNMMLPYDAPKNGKTIPAFKINLNEIDLWNKTRKPPTYWQTNLFEPLAKSGVNFWTFSIWILSLIITSGITTLIVRVINITLPLLK